MHLSSLSADFTRIANFAALPWQSCFLLQVFCDCTDRLLAQRHQQFRADKNAVKTALKAAVEQSEDSYNLVENKALSVKARAILEAYLKEVEAGYTDVFEPQNVTNFCPTDVTVGDDGFGTAVFSMPENAVDRRRGKELRMHWWQIFCVIINTMTTMLSSALKL